MGCEMNKFTAPGPPESVPYGYSSIGARPTFTWPGGHRLAVYVAVGIEEYRFGEGRVENILDTASAPAGSPDFANTSWRDYGNRVGAFRLLDRLHSRGITPTVLLNTDIYDSAPEVVAAARAVGAEMVAHGASNSDSLAGMSPPAERAYLSAVFDRLTEHEGVPPKGWSSPWLEHTPRTFELLRSVGFDYVLDLRLDDQTVALATPSGPLLAVPYALELNDSSTVVGRMTSARAFADMIVDEFDELLEVSHQQPVVMSVVVHSFISGAPFRLRALTRALDHLAAHRDEVWFATAGEIAAASPIP